MDNPGGLIDGVKDFTSEATSEINKEEDKGKVTANSQKYDANQDGKLDHKEQKIKYKAELTTLSRIQNNSIKYHFQRYYEAESEEDKDAIIAEIKDDVITIENSSTLPPSPSIWAKAAARIFEYIPILILLLMFAWL